MEFDIRKIIRWVLNIGALVLAILALPEVGAVIPKTWLPIIVSFTSVVNLILSTIRKLTSGEALLRKPF